MLDLLKTLFRHQQWADRQVLEAVPSVPGASDDERLRATLHHMVMVQRFFWSQCSGSEFQAKKEMAAPGSWEELVERFREAHELQETFSNSVTAPELERRFALPRLGVEVTVGVAMTQAVMHSQQHRGQCLTRIRELGGTPPTVDYILWVGKQPDGGG